MIFVRSFLLEFQTAGTNHRAAPFVNSSVIGGRYVIAGALGAERNCGSRSASEEQQRKEE